ncbi:hypothetical protein ABFS83_03G036400 [Erythranthe nasuta]
MALQCYTKLIHLFKKIKSSTSSSRCGLHDERPLILRHFSHPSYLKISISDGNSINKECKISGELPSFVSCCNGLALLTLSTPKRHIIFNPLKNENITTVYAPYRGGEICGFFFHPHLKKYTIISVQSEYNGYGYGYGYDYNLYSLFESKNWRKIAGPYNFPWPLYRNPAIVNNALHWLTNDTITVFDVITEEFSTRSLPIDKRECRIPRLLVKDEDRLCLCYVNCEEPVMDIWILEDYAEWSWVKKYSINLDWDMSKYPVEESFDTRWELMDKIKVISIHNNELVLYWKHRGVFYYHLELNTLEKFDFRVSLIDKLTCNDFNSLSDFEAYSAVKCDQCLV